MTQLLVLHWGQVLQKINVGDSSAKACIVVKARKANIGGNLPRTIRCPQPAGRRTK